MIIIPHIPHEDSTCSEICAVFPVLPSLSSQLKGQMSSHRNRNDDEITRSSLNPRQIAVTRAERRPVSVKVCVCVCVPRVYIPGFYWFHSRDWKPNRTELRRYYVNCLQWEMRIHSRALMITRPSFTGSDGLLSGSRELLREYDDHQFDRYIFERRCFIFLGRLDSQDDFYNRPERNRCLAVK